MIIGTFYFRRTQSGNLLGEYINQTSQKVAAESAELISSGCIGFAGMYQSTWFDGTGITARLTISILGDHPEIFTLQWIFGGEQSPAFIGRGFLNDGVLIGVYMDSDLNSTIGNIL